MTPLDFAAAEPHYADHLLPIWDALPEQARGRFFAERPAHARLTASVPGSQLRQGRPPRGSTPIVVASIKDYNASPGRPVALVEHGAGQDYGDAHPANPGGRKRERVGLFLCPNPSVAARNLAAWPDARAVVVGCPKLDRWHGRTRSGDVAMIAVTWHWDCRVWPEARTAWPHYGPQALLALAEWAHGHGHRLLGHGHPRILGRLRSYYQQAGIEIADTLTKVLDQADLLVADNTSAMYEAAAIGIPVVVLNAPWYRRDVHHGLRFWDLVPGPQVDHPDELLPMLDRVLADPRDALSSGQRAADVCYVEADGRAAERAAQALLDWAATNPTVEAPVRNPYQSRPRPMVARTTTLESPPPRTTARKRAAAVMDPCQSTQPHELPCDKCGQDAPADG